MYRIGLIGAGRKGTQHGRAYMIDNRTKVVAVADDDAENLELFQKRTGVIAYTERLLYFQSARIPRPLLLVPNREFGPSSVKNQFRPR